MKDLATLAFESGVKWVKIMNKKDCMSLFIALLLSFLYIVLLDDYYKIGLDSIMILFGVLPIFVGINTSFTYVNLGLGLTRKQISNKYLIDLIYVILLGIIYLVLISLFASLVYNTVYIPFHNVVIETVYIYSFMLCISTVVMFCSFVIDTYKKVINYVIVFFILLIFISLDICLYIYELFVVGIVISLIIFLLFLIINKKILLSKKM